MAIFFTPEPTLCFKSVHKSPFPGFLFFLYLWIGAPSGHAQVQIPSAVMVSIDANNLPMASIFSLIEKQTNFRFAYNSDLLLLQKNITCTNRSVSLFVFLTVLFHDTNISYRFIGNQIVLQKIELPEKVTVNGYIHDSKTGEVLIGASIYIPGNKTGSVSNNYGFFAVTIPKSGLQDLQVSYVGYPTFVKKINTAYNQSLDVNMEQSRDPINNVTVTDNKLNEDGKPNSAGSIDITGDILANAPSVSGNGDIMAAVQMQPGVLTGMDGTPGLFVRGGNAGQNLIQLDEATLYNPSHLFDLVSIFNSTAIKKATLLKSGFPASYGDHLSSVLDISMKDGSNQQPGANIQVGNIVSGVTLYGPIRKDKASFLIAARRSTIDLLLQPLGVTNYFSNYAFYDINAKVSYRVSQRDRIFLSFYKGVDKNNFHDETPDSSAIAYGNKFGNQALTFRWNHLFSRRLFSNTSLIYNNYYQSLTATQDDYFAQLYSGIRDVNLKTDLYYYPSQTHRIRVGINYLRQKLFPATVSDKISPTGAITDIKADEIPEKTTNRIAVYLSDNIKFNSAFHLYAGVRVPVFYTPTVKYLDVEPRISLLYMIRPTTGIKASYIQIHQYIHLVQSYNSSFPAEIWLGSSDAVKPQFGQQFSAGIFQTLVNNTFRVSLEGYYKLAANQLLFKGGTEPTIDVNLEDNLIFGKGRSYGAELLIRKQKGKLTGWLAYSLAYAYQQFDSLNLGQEFPFAYDRRHSVNLSGSYSINNHWKVSVNFFAASSRTFTIKTTPSPNTTGSGDNPLYDDEQNNNTGSVSGTIPDIEINNYRLTPYNRLDLGISYKKVRQTARRSIETEWSLSIYNVYARNNASLTYRSIDPVSKQAVTKAVSFIPVIPTITYHYTF